MVVGLGFAVSHLVYLFLTIVGCYLLLKSYGLKLIRNYYC
jgi:hypothetical protein